jgi:multimeric flavodoxin WrbA
MRALIVYESMYGNTHVVAEHIAEGLRPSFDVTVVSVADATAELVKASDLLVCGGPTHMHSMSSGLSRRLAIDAAGKADHELSLDAAAAGPGLRDWLQGIVRSRVAAAAFDTRTDSSAAFTGQACQGIARRLRRHGLHVVNHPESFLVDNDNHLLAGEAERATRWGASVAGAVTAVASRS